MDDKVIESNKRIALIPAYEPDEKMLEVAKELKDNSFLGSHTFLGDIFCQTEKIA